MFPQDFLNEPLGVPAGWTSKKAPNDLVELEKWLSEWTTIFREWPARNPRYMRELTPPGASYVRREPNPGYVKARIGIAQNTLDNAHRWLEHHAITGQPAWRRDLNDERTAEHELSKLLNFVRERLAKMASAERKANNEVAEVLLQENECNFDDVRTIVRDQWISDPIGVFGDFCDAVCDGLELTAEIHEAGRRAYEHDVANFQTANPEFEHGKKEWKAGYSEAVDRHKLVDARPEVRKDLESAYAWSIAIWNETNILSYLVRTDGPIHLNPCEAARPRYSASCYHELGMRVTGGCLNAIQAGWSSNQYHSFLRGNTAAGDSVSLYLRSLTAYVRHEWKTEIDKWQQASRKMKQREDEGGAGAIPENPSVAMDAPRNDLEQSTTSAKPFNGGTMVFYPDRVELCGATICDNSRRSIRQRKALELFRKREGARFIHYDCERLANEVKLPSGPSAVSGFVRNLRNRIKKALIEQVQIESQDEDVIRHDNGYCLSEKLIVQDGSKADHPQDQRQVHEIREGAVPDVPNVRDVLNANVLDDRDEAASAVRHAWILGQLAEGIEIQSSHVVVHFKCSKKTALRALAALKSKGKIEFVGSRRKGFYRLAEPPKTDG